ncbi:(E)-4-hydroxy-3-methylbut-2-enyl-diphosphate synthase [Alistipes sp. OttesenSCG-928-L06]|nr:(E)-4-hydroxy-3-methylbut-2-enyl-diphosphate synthase [Alistipes sp. OttesenSCG-928-L06]
MARIPFDLSQRRRRKTVTVRVGGVGIGGDNPVRVQSMANTDTNDTEACVTQALRIAEAGGELVRFTAQGRREAENLRNIKDGLRTAGCDIPLVADIHFNPEAAFVAAAIVEKVRINPGNFVDKRADFSHIDYTDEEYAGELSRLRAKFVRLLDICRQHGTALRIGVNHGSLSDRIMSRYGDTPAGMVESAMEFLRICTGEGFDQVVLSMKSSNVRVMVQAYRLLVMAMDAEGMAFPLHLGVTEAGDGEDARVKSAAGIGALLADGLGDTIRVSLTEPPENEIPVGRKLTAHLAGDENAGATPVVGGEHYSPCDYRRRESSHTGVPVVVGEPTGTEPDADVSPDNLPADFLVAEGNLHEQRAFFLRLQQERRTNPVIIRRSYAEDDLETLQLKAAADIGPLFLDGFGDGIWIENRSANITPAQVNSLAFAILQAARVRISRTEYIACPGCGRTLFDLTETLARVRAATSHLKGLKIGVMGCIVNGPGEMADADYGYVGAGPGRVTLYKGKEVMKRNIPQEESVNELLKLIKSGER